MTDWVNLSYTAMSLFVVGLLMYIMQKVEEDRWSKVDPMWLQWLRRLAFVGTSLVLLYSTSSTDWELACLFLVTASAVILFINALALSLRAPPAKGHRIRQRHPHQQHGFAYAVSRLISYFSSPR